MNCDKQRARRVGNSDARLNELNYAGVMLAMWNLVNGLTDHD